MKRISSALLLISVVIASLNSCSREDASKPRQSYPAIEAAFGNNINPNQLIEYSDQPVPSYIIKNNGGVLSNAKITLGRVLFYDKNLSVDNSISCGSCHKQEFAFGDTAAASKGVLGGTARRHSMRLINVRFAREVKFFWDKRATSLETLMLEPIQDHNEMGFSGINGRPNLTDLLSRLNGIAYYNELFQLAYNDATVTKSRIQESLAQFVRSIQSFDSRFDIGRRQVVGDVAPFPDFSEMENTGKRLFLIPAHWDAQGNRTGGGLDCNRCHQSPEFDITPGIGNNGMTKSIASPNADFDVTRAPSLRDLMKPDGSLNGPLMHAGSLNSLNEMVNHYNIMESPPSNTRLDVILKPNGFPQKLHMTVQETDALIAFLKTLSGKNVYTDVRWGNPFK